MSQILELNAFFFSPSTENNFCACVAHKVQILNVNNINQY